jgi:uncharacterized membrane-anchored protein
MFEMFTNPASVFWVAIAAMVIVPTVLQYMQKTKRDELETELKRDMIARGMGADEIERVLAAKSKKGC